REGLRFYSDDVDYANDEEKHLYQSKIESPIYGMQGIKSDIVYTVSLFSRFLAKPTKSYVKALQGVFRYLVRTLELGIVYSKHYILILTMIRPDLRSLVTANQPPDTS